MTEVVFIAFALGFILGCIFIAVSSRIKSIGNLRIDESDPDGPYLFLELSSHPEEIKKKKYVMLRVSVKNFLTRN